MSDGTLNRNSFYNYLRENHEIDLLNWCEPRWLVCVPQEASLKNIPVSTFFVEAHTLYQHTNSNSQYCSQLFGNSLIYEITGEDPRAIISYSDKDAEVLITKATIITEYLITVEDKIVHILLLDRPLETCIDGDDSTVNHYLTSSVTSAAQAKGFLFHFRAHETPLKDLNEEAQDALEEIVPSDDVTNIQNVVHDIILNAWTKLIKKHSPSLQANPDFQDLLFRALDYYVMEKCHQVLWWQICERCQTVDQIVKARLTHLHTAQLSPLQLGVPAHYYTPLPAAVVELASLSGRESPIGRLQCVSTTIDLIKAQAKEARVVLHAYKNQDDYPSLELSEAELVALLTTVVVQAQCSHLVANIYYMTHFVFSINEEHPLWKSLCLLRSSLEHIMKLDVASLPPVSAIRKELSLQDLMQVSAEVESRFERVGASKSSGDITALDLQLHQVTQQIQLSTQALSETNLPERNSPSRRSDRGMTSTVQDGSKIQSFREFLASIPSSVRASFRRRQSQQRSALQSSVN
ncbi:uncharacterized protein LOC143038799 [Oratosquilla oratoria]|uniref:uncharacterized protein LOC143038799 n=1 Tax=Oratosquilla oratoria TaxID=337810 RepID=UPI003F76A844